MKFGTFVIELTPNCNLKCLYCSAYDAKQKHLSLSSAEWKKILSHIAKLNPERIILSGGEPLLYPEFKDIYLFCLKNFSYIGITTNGTVLNESLLKIFREYPPSSIQISIDGSESYHNRLRGKGTYSKAINAVLELKRIDITVFTMTVITKQNLSLLDTFIKNMKLLGVDGVGMERMSPIGAGKNYSEFLVNASDMKQLFEKWKHQWDKDYVHINDPLFHVFEYKLKQDKKQYLACGGCMAGIKNFSVDTEGFLNICTRVPVRIGKVVDIDFEHIFTKYELLGQLAIRQIEGKCHKCERLMYCGGCRADAYGLTGNILAEDSVCWLQQTN